MLVMSLDLGFVAYENLQHFWILDTHHSATHLKKRTVKFWNMELKPKFELLGGSILESQLLQLVF
jgi:hypothetical protein